MPATRERILAAARHGFAARGFEATSLRSIANEADVDPALVAHYFGTKDGLFVAALELAIGPGELFGGLGSAGIADTAEAIVRRYLALLDRDETRDVLLGLVRSAVSSERAAAMLREFLTTQMLASLIALSDRSDGPLRASLAAAQLIGVAMLRHVVKVDAVVRASDDELVLLVAPVIASYLS